MASKNNLIKPPVVLAVVCACCCGLLAVANSVTKDKIAAAEAASIQASWKFHRSFRFSASKQ